MSGTDTLHEGKAAGRAGDSAGNRQGTAIHACKSMIHRLPLIHIGQHTMHVRLGCVDGTKQQERRKAQRRTHRRDRCGCGTTHAPLAGP